jgi:hypothetical protein
VPSSYTDYNIITNITNNVSNNANFSQRHTDVPVGSDNSEGASYPRTEEYMLPLSQAMGYIAYVPPLLNGCIRTIWTTSVLHSSQGLQLCCSPLHNAWRCLCLSLAKCHISPLRYCYISDAALSP